MPEPTNLNLLKRIHCPLRRSLAVYQHLVNVTMLPWFPPRVKQPLNCQLSVPPSPYRKQRLQICWASLDILEVVTC